MRGPRRKLNCLIILAASFLMSAASGAQNKEKASGDVYKIVPEKSEFNVYTKSVGLLSYLGHDLTIAVKEYEGKIQYDAQQPEKSSMELKVAAHSLQVTDALKPKDIRKIQHTMNEKVLKTDRFPEIQFKSTAVRSAQSEGGKIDLRVDGDLTLAGMTRTITIPAEIKWEGTELKARGEFVIRQKDFKIKPYSGMAGGIRVKNEVTLFFNFTAKK